MSFDAPPPAPRRIAVIGGGVSGLAAAWMLSPTSAVTLFEAAPRLGGHARTVMAGRRGDQPVDTGFIVFNHVNYPHLTALFRDLDVPVERSDMSFGATIGGGRIEYGLQDMAALTAQRRNLARPGFWRMVRDILRFNAGAERVAAPGMSVDDLIAHMGLGRWFRDCYLLPVAGAIWSSPAEEIGRFPAEALLRFFRNHALLCATGQHQWYTVTGGSREYVGRLAHALRGRAVRIETGAPVRAVLRGAEGPRVALDGRPAEAFDEVIFACHADQALALIDRPGAAERQVLGAIGTRPNHAVLHADPGFMPRRKRAWSSWVYRSDGEGGASVTYWMNRLQNIPQEDPLFVTLNPERMPKNVYDETVFRHPVFDAPALAAQARLPEIQGTGGVWFAGAWARNGFHEDGIASAARIARALSRVAA